MDGPLTNKTAIHRRLMRTREHWWEQNIFCLCTTPQTFWQSSAPGALSTLMTVVYYPLTWATLTCPGKTEKCVCGYIRFEFIHGALWRTLMRTEYFLFIHHTTSIFVRLSTWYLEDSGDISCLLLVELSHNDESWEGWNTWLWLWIYIYIYIYYIFVYIYKSTQPRMNLEE